ncbi:hypothetical protein [Virgibacillus salexigens]|uniref:hypothetical protein n=2 Tax=Virgibacillus salexigens TaxID=61016 RepID=UPI00190D15A4|nr:hypothetical protein [Virgibacillus salexigens]
MLDKNLKHYEHTQKINVSYLDLLSYSGWNGMIYLYEKAQELSEIKERLKKRISEMRIMENQESWQSFNFTKRKVTNK